jgi:hypothetical protein
MNHSTTLRFPVQGPSAEAIDLMRHLLCNRNERLDLARIKAHAFFASIDWANLRARNAPFRPQLSSPLDTTYFESVDADERDSTGGDAARVDVRSLFASDLRASAAPQQRAARGVDWNIDLPFM